MLGMQFIRENPGAIRKDIEKRGEKEKLAWVDDVLRKDKEYRELLQQSQELRHRRNELNKDINQLKKAGKGAEEQLAEAKKIPKQLRDIEEKSDRLKLEIRSYQMRLPNIMHESVPVGKDDTDNVEIRRWGKPPEFGFQPKAHQELMENLGIADFERAAKVAGSGFFYLKNEMVKLDMALQKFAVDFLTERGFSVIEPPLMMRREAYEGVTDLGDFETVMYKVQDEDSYLIATSEHPMGAMFKDEVIEKEKLPIRLCGVSPCFRREIGAHGKYTKGLFRVHNFNKVEQFIFSTPEDSWKLHEELQKNAEELYQALGLHYRVVNICTGDLGSIAAKKYDIEVWMADGKFREIGSNSNCTDYQARRLNIRYREKEGAPPAGYVHTLNNTAIATSRTMIAILEQYQQKDGTVAVPKVLQQYLGKRIG
jgi:seryl-tRNA synthetase